MPKSILLGFYGLVTLKKLYCAQSLARNWLVAF